MRAAHPQHISRSTYSTRNVQVRGFAGWPGTSTRLRVCASGKDDVAQNFKVVRTRLATDEETRAVAQHGASEGASAKEVLVTKAGVLLPCGDGSVLVATEVQVPGKKACSAADLANGFADKRAFLMDREG